METRFYPRPYYAPLAPAGGGREKHSLKILLQSHKTGLFLKGPLQWTANPKEAVVFPTWDAAREFCRKCCLNGHEVVLGPQ